MKITYPIPQPHTLSVAEALQTLQTSLDTGLNTSEAETRAKEFGFCTAFSCVQYGFCTFQIINKRDYQKQICVVGAIIICVGFTVFV